MSATLELQDITGKKRMAKCLTDPASSQLGFQQILICGLNGAAVNLVDVSAANAARSTATNVMCVQVIDATGAVMSTTVSLANVTGTDGAAAPARSLLVGGKDGAGNHQDLLVGTAGQLNIDFYSARPGESVSDDWVKQCIQSHMKIGPSATGPTAITTDTIALASLDVSTYGPFDIMVYSNGAALNACKVQVSPDGTTGWKTLLVKDADETAAEACASGAVEIAYKFAAGWGGFLRVLLSTGTATNATVWLIGRM